VKVVGLASKVPKGELGVSNSSRGKEFFSFLKKHPDRLWDPLTHIFHVYRVLSQI